MDLSVMHVGLKELCDPARLRNEAEWIAERLKDRGVRQPEAGARTFNGRTWRTCREAVWAKPRWGEAPVRWASGPAGRSPDSEWRGVRLPKNEAPAAPLFRGGPVEGGMEAACCRNPTGTRTDPIYMCE